MDLICQFFERLQASGVDGSHVPQAQNQNRGQLAMRK